MRWARCATRAARQRRRRQWRREMRWRMVDGGWDGSRRQQHCGGRRGGRPSGRGQPGERARRPRRQQSHGVCAVPKPVGRRSARAVRPGAALPTPLCSRPQPLGGRRAALGGVRPPLRRLGVLSSLPRRPPLVLGVLCRTEHCRPCPGAARTCSCTCSCVCLRQYPPLGPPHPRTPARSRPRPRGHTRAAGRSGPMGDPAPPGQQWCWPRSTTLAGRP